MIQVKSIGKAGKQWDARKIAAAIEAALDDAADEAERLFSKATATWKHKPRFSIAARKGHRRITTTSEIYGYVSGGTRPHVIRPRRAKRLRFATGGSPKTRPGSLSSSAGRTGSTVVYSRGVNHPGSEARDFEVLVGDEVEPILVDAVEAVIRNIP